MESNQNKPDLLAYNRQAWDNAVESGDRWTQVVSPEVITRAREGDLQLVLTPQKRIPAAWLGELKGKQVLCLASGGGQQGPVLAAAGAQVTVYDNSPKQLQQDRHVAERDGLALDTVLGDMRDLSLFASQRFDLIVHPVSNCFVDTVIPVWQEAYRVLKPGGRLLSGFCNPILFCYDMALEAQGILQLKYPVPFAAESALSPEDFQREYLDKNEPLQFGHSLSDQIGGQLAAGFVLKDMYEDHWGDRVHDQYLPHFIATYALKL